MLLILSPAKRLDYERAVPTGEYSQPRCLDEARLLIERLRKLSPAEIASLMGLSDPLAALNFSRYAEWNPPFSPQNARQALFAFAGDVYEGLDAPSLAADGITFAQAHLRILSGLYGLLRPLDLMQPYRLEMGTKLVNPRGRNLYDFWGGHITGLLAADLKAADAKTLVNLASNEYSKSVQMESLPVCVLHPVFEDWKNGKYRVVSFYAKRARGLMARYTIERRLCNPEGLKRFDSEGYEFAPQASDDEKWVFRRKQ